MVRSQLLFPTTRAPSSRLVGVSPTVIALADLPYLSAVLHVMTGFLKCLHARYLRQQLTYLYMLLGPGYPVLVLIFGQYLR